MCMPGEILRINIHEMPIFCISVAVTQTKITYTIHLQPLKSGQPLFNNDLINPRPEGYGSRFVVH